MKANFDSTVSLELNTILREDENSQKTMESGSREAEPSSPSHSHQIAFSSEIPFSKTRKVW